MDFINSRLNKFGNSPAITIKNQTFSYADILRQIENYKQRDELRNVGGRVVFLVSDFSIYSASLMLHLIFEKAIVVPISPESLKHMTVFSEIAEAEIILNLKDNGSYDFETKDVYVNHHPLINKIISQKVPGLILFSSGSSGSPKAAIHDLSKILDKFRIQRPNLTMLAFLLFDHIGGINTLLASLCNGSHLIIPDERSPERICCLIEAYDVQVLPTTPTFLRMLIISEAYKRFNLSSLQTITYGTEVMPQSTLDKLNEVFPDTKFHQTYGLTEVGILRSKSESSNSLWVKIGGEGFETRIDSNSCLEIKAQSAMLGYLNAPSPFTEDGWFKTGDAVEVKGEYFKILGRKSEIINVGGEKVYPTEIESIIQSIPGVEQALVYGERNAILGQIVVAEIIPEKKIDPQALKKVIREICAYKLERFKVPQKIMFTESSLTTDRFKKNRKHK